MPTILKIEGYRFFFFSNEHLPSHIHIEKGDGYAKVELHTLNVVDSHRFTPKELKKIIELVRIHRETLQEAWDEYFKNSDFH